MKFNLRCKNKYLQFFSLVFLVGCPSLAFSGDGKSSGVEKPLVVVMPIENGSQTLPDEVTSKATEYLRGLIAASEEFVVVGQGRQSKKLKNLIQSKKEESYKECYDESCQISLGKALSADTLIRTKITHFSRCILNIEVIDLAKEASIVAAQKEFSCKENDLKGAIDELSTKISEGFEQRSQQDQDWEPGEASVGILKVSTEPSGMSVFIDGTEVGKSPISREVKAGRHGVRVEEECRDSLSKTIEVTRSGNHEVNFAPEPKPAGVEVHVQTEEKEAVSGKVLANGKELGTAPGRFKLSSCTEELKIKASGYPEISKKISLEPKKTKKITVTLASKTNLSRKAQQCFESGDYQCAKKWAKTGCDEGAAVSCFLLGRIWFTGKLGTKDLEQSAVFHQKACDKGHSKSCLTLALQYTKGLGVKKKMKTAITLYKKACREGRPLACYSSGKIYEKGKGVTVSQSKARDWYGVGCKKGGVKSCYELGTYQEHGQAGSVDYERSRNSYEKACAGENMRSCYNLGQFYESGRGGKKEFSKAINLYKKACKADILRACHKLGFFYSQGEGVEHDNERAREYWKKACEGGLSQTCNNLGGLYEYGAGVPKDVQRARRLYKKACESGSKKGCENLKRIQK
jgi:TPR repeat protein